ncbi:MAG: DUF3540 domain-containing protein [Proteobacteria bacterium]|nr:DUF3540 domain-containing protein [Pseudomonadota bacterium]
MNMTVQQRPTKAPCSSQPGASLRFEHIQAQQRDDLWLLQSKGLATRALSCLIEPLPGDRVLVAVDGEESVILSVISRSGQATVSLRPANGGDLQVSAPAISLTADREIEVQAQTSVMLCAPFGAVEAVAHSLTQSVSSSVVTVADSIVEKARNVHLTADESIITRARVHSVTADQDLFMDADRINMG